jgi:hypothetical protein
MQGTRQEFTTHDTEGTLATVVTDACVNHIPVLTGGAGKNEELREFYSKPATFPSRALKAREGHGSEPAVERAD